MKKKLYVVGLTGALLLASGGMLAEKTEYPGGAVIDTSGMTELQREVHGFKETYKHWTQDAFQVGSIEELKEGWKKVMKEVREYIEQSRKRYPKFPALKLHKEVEKYLNREFVKRKKAIEGFKPLPELTPPWEKKAPGKKATTKKK